MLQIIEVDYKWNKELQNRHETKNLILHHAEARHCDVNDIHKWHQENGWAGIGYHFFIDKEGRIFRGRPLMAVGAHTLGYNDNSLAICFGGDFDNDYMPDVQFSSGVETIRDLRKQFKGLKIFRHCDVNNTRCPGEHFRNKIIFDGMEDKPMSEPIDDVKTAIAVLVENGIMNSPDYWVKTTDVVMHQSQLIINMAKFINEKK